MATLSQTAAARPMKIFAGPRGLVDKYFYFGMSLLFPAIVVWGFSRTVNASLFHAAPPRPLLLWFHGAAFSGWIVFFMFQSVLVRTRNVKWHRFFGWLGVALGTAMVPLGIAIAIVMGRFDTYQLHQSGAESFLIIPFYDMAAFGTLVTLAIAWRRKPELHRRLLLVATCLLLDAAFARFDFIFDHSLFLILSRPVDRSRYGARSCRGSTHPSRLSHRAAGAHCLAGSGYARLAHRGRMVGSYCPRHPGMMCW